MKYCGQFPLFPQVRRNPFRLRHRQQPGVYPYVCTYPGHGFVMYGAMYVTPDDTLPDIKNDSNIPESRRQDEAKEGKEGVHAHDTMNANPHPYALIPPYFYHVFIEGASPDVIAVHLPEDLSYAWDAGDLPVAVCMERRFPGYV